MASPICQVKEDAGAYGPTTNGVDATAGSTMTINLVSSAGVSSWAISCVGTDENQVAEDITDSLTIDGVQKTATFTQPEAGTALIFQSSVTDTNGVTTSTTFGIFTPTVEGLRVGAVGEGLEGSSAYGWVTKLNAMVRRQGETYTATRGSMRSVFGEVQTSSTSPTTVASYEMADETMCAFDVIVTMARRTSVTKAGRYKRSVVYHRTGASAPNIVGALELGDPDEETTAGDDVTIDVSSNTVRVRVTAADTDPRNWFAEMRVQTTLAT